MNRILMHLDQPCEHCALRHRAEQLAELAERIEDAARTPRPEGWKVDHYDIEDDEEDEGRPVIGINAPDAYDLESEGDEAKYIFRLRMHVQHLPVSGDLRQHTVSELRRCGEELLAAADRLEGGAE